jgi:hypothetical protein
MIACKEAGFDGKRRLGAVLGMEDADLCDCSKLDTRRIGVDCLRLHSSRAALCNLRNGTGRSGVLR